MRIAVLIVGILGSLGAGTLGVLWMLACQKDKQDLQMLRLAGMRIPAEVEDEYVRRSRAYPFLLAGVVLGGTGAALAMAGRGKSAGALLLTAGAGPAVLNPASLIFTFLLPVAGVLAFFVRPREPAPEPGPARALPVEAESVTEPENGESVKSTRPERVRRAGRGA
jgi:hypothetical protein